MPEQMITEPKKKVPVEEAQTPVAVQAPKISMSAVPKKTGKAKPLTKEQQELIGKAKESVETAIRGISTSFAIEGGYPHELELGLERLSKSILETKKSGEPLFGSSFLRNLRDSTPQEALASAKKHLEQYKELAGSAKLAGKFRSQMPEEFANSMKVQSSINRGINLAEASFDAMEKANAADLSSIVRICNRLSTQIKSVVFQDPVSNW